MRLVHKSLSNVDPRLFFASVGANFLYSLNGLLQMMHTTRRCMPHPPLRSLRCLPLGQILHSPPQVHTLLILSLLLTHTPLPNAAVLCRPGPFLSTRSPWLPPRALPIACGSILHGAYTLFIYMVFVCIFILSFPFHYLSIF